ncbi:class I SAM-dependent methyltransferase [Candidatus Marinamargulisbacteria bacterium SCGC AG-439-L15]|nr:class I SAM-dependent methyltransferase [Candidatus Marinamargulisbacteria bacterium SCGC AG-439-L15]
MTDQYKHKSTVNEIKARFDSEVDRFSNLETGQSATIDAPLVLDLITDAACATNKTPGHILDIGCGAGNYTLKLLEKVTSCQKITLIDLSRAMLDRAKERIEAVSQAKITLIQGDIRSIDLGNETFDMVFAAAVLHHLREDSEWESVFSKIYESVTPEGSFWVSDLVSHDNHAIHQVMWDRYGEYLSCFKDDSYRDDVFAYISKEDSPRSLMFQLALLKKAGFSKLEILHKNAVFSAFSAIK